MSISTTSNRATMQKRRDIASRTSSSGSWNRLRPVTQDPLEEYGLPSKGDKRLLNHQNQERFYARIAERYMSFCTEAGDSTSLLAAFSSLSLTEPTSASNSTTTSSPSPATRANPNTLPLLLTALRKLREGLVASARRDSFAVQVYLFNIRLGILTSHPETYHPALLHLLRVIQPLHPLTTVELSEAVSYLILDAACRRGDLATAYALRNKYRLQDAKVDAVLAALVRDDWVSFWRVRKGVDGHRAKLLELAERDVRKRMLKAFGRAYLSVDKAFLERSAGMGWEELKAGYGVGWEVDGERVVIRRVGGR